MWRILLASAVGGLLGWLVVGAVLPVFKLPAELQNLPSPVPQDKSEALVAATKHATLLNTMLAIALIGSLVGLCAQSAGFSTRRSWTEWTLVTVAGIAAGGAFGMLAAAAGTFTMEHLSSSGDTDVFQISLACHTVALGVFGLGLGLAMTATWRDWRHLLAIGIGGLASGAVAGVLFVFLVAIFWPHVHTETVLPDEAQLQLFWAFSAIFLVAIASVRRNRRWSTRVA